MSRTNLTIILVSCLFAAVFASSQCSDHLANARNAIFSLQSSVFEDDAYDIFLALASLSGIAQQLHHACQGTIADLKLMKDINTEMTCEESTSYIFEVAEELYTDTDSPRILEKLINFVPIFEEACLSSKMYHDMESLYFAGLESLDKFSDLLKGLKEHEEMSVQSGDLDKVLVEEDSTVGDKKFLRGKLSEINI